MGSQRVGHEWTLSTSLSESPYFKTGRLGGSSYLVRVGPPLLSTSFSHSSSDTLPQLCIPIGTAIETPQLMSTWLRFMSDRQDHIWSEGSADERGTPCTHHVSVSLSSALSLHPVSRSVISDSEKAVASYSSALACKIPWMEEPGGLQSMGSLRVRHDWATSLSLFTFLHWRRKWQPTPVFLPGESQRQGSLVGCRLWGRTESDMTEAT